MARARLYGWAPRRTENPATAKKVNELKGQAAVVRDIMDGMAKDSALPALATIISEAVEKSGKLVTRQEVLRVTLYYLLVFKKRGWVVAQEQEVPEDDDIDGSENGDEDDTDGDEDAETEDEAAETIQG